MKKKLKTVLICGLAALLCVCLLAGCGAEKAEEIEAKGETVQGIPAEAGIKPGAVVSHGRDEQGNKTFEYTNPDGSGGGGVEVDLG